MLKSVLESSGNRKSKKEKKKSQRKRERDSYEKIIRNELEKEKEGR